jgi:hypothetical protein
MNPEQEMYDTYYFIHPVMEHWSYSPEGSVKSDNGVTFDILSESEHAVFTVTVPWGNIAYVVEEQHWLRDSDTFDDYYEQKRVAEEKRWEQINRLYQW